MSLSNRFYLRGTSPLGLFNTVTGSLFNKVLVRVVYKDTGEVFYRWDKATNWPPVKEKK